MAILGLDIGGANLKAAHSDGTARTVPFELWKAPEKLHRELKKLAKAFPKFDRVAVTMTGESCDCYLTKREGVNAILDQVLKVFPEESIRVWLVDEGFQSVARARELYLRTASSNWHVLASYCGTLHPKGAALLIDIGSTTTDIIPIVDGKPASRGKTDAERLQTQELVYMGVGRTPVGMVLPYNHCRELFATMLDCHVLLDHIPEDGTNADTADGRPVTKYHCANRIARMFGADIEMTSVEDIIEKSKFVHFTYLEYLKYPVFCAFRDVRKRLRRKVGIVFASGSGEFLVDKIWRHPMDRFELPQVRMDSLGKRLGADLSSAACAWALTQMAGFGREVEI